MSETISTKTIWKFWLGVAIFTALFIYFLSPVLAPFLTAALIAYMGNPIVNCLVKIKVPRILAVVFVFLLLIVGVTFLLLTLIPLLEEQITWLIQQIPNIYAWLQNKVIPMLKEKLDITWEFTMPDIQTVLSKGLPKAGNIVSNILQTITSSTINIVKWMTNFLLVFVVAFYLLRDWDSVLENIENLLPRNVVGTVGELFGQCNEVVGAFFRGQLIVMFALGTIYSVGLMFAGLNVALLIGLLAGLVSIVPYLGFIVGITVASVAAFFQFHDMIHIVYVWATFAVGQMAESMVLTPLLVGDRIGLHPVAVIFAILAGGQLFGFVGVLLALPVAAAMMVFVRYAILHYQSSNLYQTVSELE